MSLKTWKETLKPCTTTTILTSTSSSISSSIHDEFDTNINPRIPSKASSLYKKILRLEDPLDFLPQFDQDTQTHDVEDEKEPDGSLLAGSKSDLLHFDHTGPYEPLVLHESPLVQVLFLSIHFLYSELGLLLVFIIITLLLY